MSDTPRTVLDQIEQIIDEESAWIASPNKEVVRRIAIAATFAAHFAIKDGDTEEITELKRELATERARADKAEADAKRYRWLRSWTRVGHWSVSRWRVGEGRYEPVPQEAKMDAAIDKAMKGEK